MGQREDRPVAASPLVAAFFRCSCRITLSSDATRMDATSWHPAQRCPVTPVLACGFALLARLRPAVPGSPSLTAPSSRQTRNVASDATPRPWASVAAVCRAAWNLMTGSPAPSPAHGNAGRRSSGCSASPSSSVNMWPESARPPRLPGARACAEYDAPSRCRCPGPRRARQAGPYHTSLPRPGPAPR